MNCTSARFALAVIQPNSPDSMVPEFDAELAHVRECPECQEFRQTLQRSDRIIGAAMRNVTTPAGLKSRLLSQLALRIDHLVSDDQLSSDRSHHIAGSSDFAVEFHSESLDVQDKSFGSNESLGSNQNESRCSNQNESPRTVIAGTPTERPVADIAPIVAIPKTVIPAAASSSPAASSLHAVTSTTAEQAPITVQRGMNRRSLLTLAGLAAAILVGLGLWWLVNRDQRHRLPIGDVLAMCQNLPKPGAGPFQHEFDFEFPTSTLPFTRDLDVSSATSLQFGESSTDGPEIGAVFSFSIRMRSLVPAYLVVIDLKQIDVPDLSPDAYSFASAHVHYPKPNEFPTRVWREGQQLYICYARSADSAVLELLLPHASAT